ncbi:MAG: NAD-dependent epimerase/dehydratase family protein [Candidatus Margulisiibacteriota bacterium]
MHKQNCLVTGATGYVGSNLIQRLFDMNFNVGILTRNKNGCPLKNKEIKMFEYNQDFMSVKFAIDSFKPTLIIHLAAFQSVETNHQIDELISANITFGSYLLDAIKDNKKVYFINIGTYWQFTSTNCANTFYAATKTAFQSILDYYTNYFNISAYTLVLMDVYGPNDPRKKLIPLLLNAARTNQSFNMTSGTQKKNFVYIDDVIDSIIHALSLLQNDQSNTHQMFYVSTSELISIRSLVDKITKILNKNLNITYNKPKSLHEINTPIIKNRLPEWEPKFSLDQGLKKCCNE